MKRVLVIGGGPAGSLAAMLLAREKVPVTLIEQSRFPRDKVCGECVSPLGIDVLSRNGLIHRLRLRGAIDLTRSLFHASTGESCEIPLPKKMLGISRSTLDAFLLEQAKFAGVTVFQPSRVDAITSTFQGVTVTIRSMADHSVQELSADLAILADGKGKLLARPPLPTSDFGIKAHFTGIDAPANAIELFGVIGHYGGLSEVEGGRWNSSFSVPADRLRAAHGYLDRLFAQIVTENSTLAKRFANAQRCSDWCSSPLPRFNVIDHWPTNVIPIGNAAAAVEPIGGEGIGLALRSAELAAHAILSDSFDPAALRASFKDLWLTRRLACRLVAKLISSPMWGKHLVSLATEDDPFSKLAMSWMGKA